MQVFPPINQPLRGGGRVLLPAMLRRPGDVLPLYAIELDGATSLVRGEARGAWTVAETERYCTDLRGAVEAARSLFGKVRVLLDRRDISVQCDEVRAMLAEANDTIFAADDRLALIVDTSLMKVSLRQRMPHSGTKAFLSISAAETWLSA